VFAAKLPKVVASISQGSNGIRCEFVLKNAKSPHYLTTLEVPRGWAEQVSLGVPSSFRVQPLPADGMDSNWIIEWNRKNLRLVGCLELQPNTPARLFLPARLPLLPDLVINGQFESSRTAGGTVAFFRASHAEFGSEGSGLSSEVS